MLNMGRAGLFFAGAVAVAGLGVVALQAGSQVPQGQQPTFRAGTRIVPVWATVRDKGGAFQLDLTKDDFEITDNGKVQKIDQFTREAQPLSVVVVIDGSSSMMPVFQSVLDGVNQFVIRLMPGDEGRIASFADQTRMSPSFTSNRDDLLDYLRDQFNIRMANDTRLWDGLADAMTAVGQRKGNRRVVVVLHRRRRHRAARRHRKSGRVDGQQPRHDHLRAGDVGPRPAIERSGGRPNPRIEALATQTGGGFYELHEQDDMNSTFTGIAEELHNQYVLGFSPAALDGKEHKLEVRVKRPNMLVRARRSHIADAGFGRPPCAEIASCRPRRLASTLAVAILTTLLAVGRAGPSAQGTVYKSRSDLVSLFATVTDADDAFVDALPKDAFEVYDNGKRQTISLFTREVQPISVVILLDRSGSMVSDADRVRNAASEFVKRMLPTDRARIGQFAGRASSSTPADFHERPGRAHERAAARPAAGRRVADLDGDRSRRDRAPARGRAARDPAPHRRP